MSTEFGVRVSLPVLSPLFSDSWIWVIVIVTLEPAGITTRPWLSWTSLDTVAVTTAPALSVREVISRSTARDTVAPASSASGAGAGAGLALGFGAALGLAATGVGAAAGLAA